MQRYELVEGSSSKFWEVWTDAATLYVRFGKIGSQGQTKLKKLGSDVTASAEQEIPRAKVTRQLKTLDLSKGTMCDVGGQALLDGKSALAHLEKLDLSQNYLSKDMAKQLKAVFGDRVDVSSQGAEVDDDDDRYVQIAE
jgi:predicted DNA-binding WGR domain protein